MKKASEPKCPIIVRPRNLIIMGCFCIRNRFICVSLNSNDNVLFIGFVKYILQK